MSTISMENNKSVSTDTFKNMFDPSVFFEKDSNFVYVFKRTEKLASAVYMISNILSDNEPMKWALRSRATDLTSFMLNFKDAMGPNYSEFVYSAKSRVLELISFLEILYRSGYVSEMNLSILRGEFVKLIEVLDTSHSNRTELSVGSLSKSFFTKGEGDYIKDTSNHGANQVVIKDTGVLRPRGEFKRTNRQNIILNLLKRKSELTIKDISAVIRDCSEKTIQRELTSFISAGALKRTGERRWSKYSLL